MQFGKLESVPALERTDLLAESTARAIDALKLPDVLVAEIDPKFADTATFCEHYGILAEQVGNCVILEASRGDRKWLAACVVLATTRADVNGLARRQLDARKASFASQEKAVAETKMEYGGITPVGLPEGFPILIDAAVAASDYVVLGSGIRGSKLFVRGAVLAQLPNVVVLEHLGKPVLTTQG